MTIISRLVVAASVATTIMILPTAMVRAWIQRYDPPVRRQAIAYVVIAILWLLPIIYTAGYGLLWQ